jgi:hypothetical protein
LTPDRIVYVIPVDVVEPEEGRYGTIREIVKYLISPEIATRPEDQTIVDAVKGRMEAPDYRLIINSTLNVHNDRIDDAINNYLYQKDQEGDEGNVKFNFADIAIVTHDEGGKGLEYRL